MLGARLDVISFTVLAVDACAKAMDGIGAEKWVAKMLEANGAPAAVTCNAAFTRSDTGAMVHYCLAIFHELLKVWRKQREIEIHGNG